VHVGGECPKALAALASGGAAEFWASVVEEVRVRAMARARVRVRARANQISQP